MGFIAAIFLTSNGGPKMKSTRLTEKQQEVLWLRYGRKASLEEIALWLGITRRSVLTRLRNARRKVGNNLVAFSDLGKLEEGAEKRRKYAISQILAETCATPMDEL
jgi:DNA-binding CsgD family transcriptional regulator